MRACVYKDQTSAQNFLKIYTDGSKDPQNNTNGCAFVIPELKFIKGFKLQSHMSIFMCELTAICLALNWIQDFKPLNTVIFVDSLSRLQAIKGSINKVKYYIIYDIYNIFTSLSNIGINDISEWIPSHVGKLGNQLADKEAKHSLSLKNIYVLNPLYKEDIKTLSRTFLKDMWQHKWDINLKGRHLYGINKTVCFAITAPKRYRYHEIVFSGYGQCILNLIAI